MNRLTVTFVVLAATGGCMAVDRDPVYEYEAPRRRTTQAWAPPSGQTDWRTANGQNIQGGAAATASSSMSWPQRTAASQSSTSSTADSLAATTANKTTTTAQSKPKPDFSEALVQATYVKAPPLPSCKTTSTPNPFPALGAVKGGTDMTRTAEAKSAPVNLGVLRLLNSKRITFHYEVKDAGSAGVSGLELWGTKDMRSWKKYEAVQRTPKSFIVDVKEEGLYGFTMMARGKEELTKNQPPKPGEPPQVWVAVDLTKPDVQLLGAELNIMSSSPAVVIRWTAKDTHFGPRPITLLYAEHMEGPWTPIAANLENSGRHEWNLQACVPSSVYVRVQATDMMGNTAMAQTTTLHIPGRTTVTALRGEPTNAEPPRLLSVASSPTLDLLRPVAATVANPAVSILSVDGE